MKIRIIILLLVLFMILSTILNRKMKRMTKHTKKISENEKWELFEHDCNPNQFETFKLVKIENGIIEVLPRNEDHNMHVNVKYQYCFKNSDCYILDKIIGLGGNGFIFSAFQIFDTNQERAIKVLCNLNNRYKNHYEEVYTKIKTVQQEESLQINNNLEQNQNNFRTMQVFDFNTNYAFLGYTFVILAELIKGVDFEVWMKNIKINDSNLKEKTTRETLINLIDFVDMFHKKYELVHTDIKPINIMIDKDGFVLVDFDNALTKNDKYYYQGTIIYMYHNLFDVTQEIHINSTLILINFLL